MQSRRRVPAASLLEENYVPIPRKSDSSPDAVAVDAAGRGIHLRRPAAVGIGTDAGRHCGPAGGHSGAGLSLHSARRRQHAGLSALRRSVLLFRAAILRMEGTSMRKKKSTQQLVGIERVTDSSVLTAGGELTFYLVQPTNLNVLPESGVRTRVTALLNVLKTSAEMELLALDSKESYQDNRLYYRRRAEEEGNPAIRALLAQDRRHLDDVQTMMASSRQFCFVLRRRKTDGAINLATVEQRLRDSGFTVRRVEGAELLELLAIYFEQDATHEVFDLIDGAHWLTAEMEEENADFES